jgi:ferritin-like metal-binding protein YciE
MKIKKPAELLLDQIRDLYDVESQVSLTMPELTASATDPLLRDFLSAQERMSLVQKERLKQAAEALGGNPGGDTCKAMEGLIEGGNQHIENAEGSTVTDLILIAHVNRIIHYQIAGYGFADALAKRLQQAGPDELLSTSLAEETAGAEALAGISIPIFGAAEEGDAS